jgi:hypothetical protein
MTNVPEVSVGAPLRHRAVSVLPLFSPERSAIHYRIGADAIAAGALEIREAGAVDKLEAKNRGRERVFLLEGDHLVGARQNRVVTSSVLIGGKRALTLSVSCVEQGRWSGGGSFRGASSLAPAFVRRTLKQSVTSSLFTRNLRAADQSRIWSQIAEQQARLNVTSATHALEHTYAARAHDVGDVATRVPYPEHATGLAVAIGGELVSLDLFDKPATCRFYWRWLVDGAALEAIGRPVGRGVGPSEVHHLFAELRRAEWRRVTPVGEGDEARARTPDLAASLLSCEGQLVHFGAALGGALSFSPRILRRDLPEPLAQRYRIVERIGAGGAKEVFRAADLSGAPDVAIARIPAVDPEEFAREAQVAASVGGAFTPRVFGSLVDEHGDGYIVMEHCAGPNLAQVAGRPLEVDEAAPILVAFARALASIHEHRVLHRDVKLENAVLCSTAEGVRLKILDFGISARAETSTTAVGQLRLSGTAPYMASEVLRGLPVDARSDVFAFGVCCFRLLTGGVPCPPHDGEGDLNYLLRLSQIAAHDVSRVPALPAPAGAILARMLDVDPERRPFMPEVVLAFERAFGDPPLVVPSRAKRRAARTPPPLRFRIAVPVAAPDHVLVAPCLDAPIVALEPGERATLVRAFGADGEERWSRRIAGRLDTGLRADLDGDGAREIYLAGAERIVALGARGEVRFERAASGASSPTMIAVADPRRPSVVVDGLAFDPRTGAAVGQLRNAYEGDGRTLIDARALHGVSFNGFARQSFRGGHATAAAIVSHPRAERFSVVHLEETSGGRVQLVVYGPGGARLHVLAVADRDLRTGEPDARAPFGPEHAPLALLGDASNAVVVAPLASTLAAFELPSGRELWRAPGDGGPSRAIFADLEGDGRPRLLVGTGAALVSYDPWTGAEATLGACGAPLAFGDPFHEGFAHLFTASREGIEVRRAYACRPGAMQWSGARGDVWRTGTMRADGAALGPI